MHNADIILQTTIPPLTDQYVTFAYEYLQGRRGDKDKPYENQLGREQLLSLLDALKSYGTQAADKFAAPDMSDTEIEQLRLVATMLGTNPLGTFPSLLRSGQ